MATSSRSAIDLLLCDLPALEFSGYPAGARQRNAHRGGFTVKAADLPAPGVRALPARPRDGLAFERQHGEIVGKTPPCQYRIEPRGEIGSCVVMPADRGLRASRRRRRPCRAAVFFFRSRVVMPNAIKAAVPIEACIGLAQRLRYVGAAPDAGERIEPRDASRGPAAPERRRIAARMGKPVFSMNLPVWPLPTVPSTQRRQLPTSPPEPCRSKVARTDLDEDRLLPIGDLSSSSILISRSSGPVSRMPAGER